ncbi:MAG: glycosyltransferase family 39 protein [Enterococcus sp.]
MYLGKKSVYRFFLLLASFFMLWATVTSITSPKIGGIFSLFRNIHSVKVTIILNILCLIIAFFIYFIILQLIKKTKAVDIKKKYLYIFLTCELALYFIGILAFTHFIGFNHPVDDTRIVLNNIELLNNGQSFGYNYMYSNPQNLLLMYLFIGIQYFLGSSYTMLIVIFAVIHILTILILFFSLKNLGITNFISLLVLQLLILAIQITLHVPVAYTDILSLFFIAITFFFITNYVKKQNEQRKWAVPNLLLALTFCTLGFISKGTLLILILAIAVFLFLTNTKWKKLLALLPFVFLCLGNLGWAHFINSQNLYPDNNYGQPNTHYLMMGINHTPIPNDLSQEEKARWTVGTYSSDEQGFTWKLFLEEKKPKEEVKKAHLEIIKKRYSELSFRELLAVFNNKVSVTWGSGDLKSSFEVFLGTGKNEERIKLFTNMFSGTILYMWMMTVQYLIYVGVIFTGFYLFKQRQPIALLATIYISGYFTFLLIWEASPRYAMGIFIPAILLIGLSLNHYRYTLKKKTKTDSTVSYEKKLYYKR